MLDIYSGLTPRDYVEFGVSAINQPSESVRRIADRIIITMYHTHPKLVRQHLPLEQDVSPKNVHYRQLFCQFDEIDKEVSLVNFHCGFEIFKVLKCDYSLVFYRKLGLV